MRQSKVSFVQFESSSMKVSENVDKAINFMKQASSEGSDLIVFPELFNTGYVPSDFDAYFNSLAESEKGITIKSLSEQAANLNLNVVAPIPFKSNIPGVIYNSAVVINKNGEYQGAYHKTHLWSKEREYFKEGNNFPVFQLDIGTIGIVICYDGGFPEASRSLALKGAELILCPSAFPDHDKDLWDIYFKSRSLENTCFVAGINQVSNEKERQMFGNNQLYNPRGQELLNGSLDVEEIQTVKINFDDVTNFRSQVPFLKDLKPEIYYENS